MKTAILFGFLRNKLDSEAERMGPGTIVNNTSFDLEFEVKPSAGEQLKATTLMYDKIT